MILENADNIFMFFALKSLFKDNRKNKKFYLRPKLLCMWGGLKLHHMVTFVFFSFKM